MPSHTDLPLEPLDVLIMGAGVSGIGAAAYLRRDQPHKVIAILESREQMGGTGICSVIRVFVRTRICIPLVLTLNPGRKPNLWPMRRTFSSICTKPLMNMR